MRSKPKQIELTPDVVLAAYAQGIFPMADSRHGDAVYWYRPDPRGILPLDDFHVPKSLGRLVRQQRFEVTADRAFEKVIRACADRPSTWISEKIIDVFIEIHRLGFAHSMECWQAGELVGGLYGIALNGAFFGESMFHRVSNASKVALVHLVRRLCAGGFTLLDIQWTTSHLEQFGAHEIPREVYEQRLKKALHNPATW